MGATCEAESVTSNQRTRCLDVKHNFLVDLAEEGFLDVAHANSTHATLDALSKSVTKEVCQHQTPKFMAGKSTLH